MLPKKYLKPFREFRSVNRRWKLALAAAILNDVLDLLGPGNLPLLGDALVTGRG